MTFYYCILGLPMLVYVSDFVSILFSERWSEMGEELLTFKDRHNLEHCLAPVRNIFIIFLVNGFQC